ncbi:hypothetical protein ISG33_11195 [Glaciecola sp. MH2013]|uniref:hypothetical protein n=1 Tax=Glaciecola sp. MH2013 TaxID=2785524 RepID=UPI00189DBA24|nr:hypothetical protein [Glaciecola sp. MH2013]MBF7073965.1 hypothetical protein [Glaciecola sp. MH2013]
MGILKRYLEIEDYLSNAASNYFIEKDLSYAKVIKLWRSKYELDLTCGNMLRGERALQALSNNLPFDGYILNLPNYKFLPSTCGSDRQVTFCYHVEKLEIIDRSLLNSFGAVVIQYDMNFMCAFNKEGPVGYPEIYVDKRN